MNAGAKGELSANRRRSVVIFACTFLVLEVLTFARMPPDLASEYDQATLMVVTNSVYRKATRGMSAPLADSFEAGSTKLVAWNGAAPDRNYLRQFGGSIFALAAFAPHEPDRIERYLLTSRYAFAAISSVVVALVVTLLTRSLGLPTGLALLAFLACEGRYVVFLRSLYWVPGLSLLPLLVVLALYQPGAPPSPRRLTVGLFAAAVCLRALCGYEHISVPVLMACPAILLRGAAASRKTLVRDCVRYVVAGGIGTALAIAIHFVSVYWAFGSWHEAYENTVGNAIRRSVGEHEHMRGMNTVRAQLLGIYGTLAQNKLLTIVLGLWGLAFGGYLVGTLRKAAWIIENHSLRTLALASVAALAASCSWLVLMRVHTAVHPQYNNLVFYQGFIWFGIPFVVAYFGALVRRRQSRRVSTGKGSSTDVA